MRFSLRLNNDLPLARYVEVARAAEESGFDQFWVSHDLFLRSAPVVLSAVAQATGRIGIGSCILNPYTTTVAEIAMTAATLQELSEGRFHLGVAAGAGDFLEWIGERQRRPLQRMRESIQVLRTLLAGERAAFEGEELSYTEDAYLRFEQTQPVPIYLGANGPKMLALAGELADGVLPLLFPPEHWHGVRPLIALGEERRALEQPPDVAACVWVSIDRDRERAQRLLAEKIAYYGHSLSPLIFERLGLQRADFDHVFRIATRGGDLSGAAAQVSPAMLQIGIAGTAKDVVERLRPLVDAGVRHLSFGPPLGHDVTEAVLRLGAEVLPAFAATE